MDALCTKMRWKEMENTIKTYEKIIDTQKKMIDILLENQRVIVMSDDEAKKFRESGFFS